MARDTDFAQQTERAYQAANVGMTWARDFAEESFTQSKKTFDGFLRVTRKMAEELENQASAIREQATVIAEQTLSNTMDYGQKLARVKEPQEFAQCQSDYMVRQVQTIADQTKEFGQKMQQAAKSFATASTAMAEAGRRSEEAVSAMTSRAEQASKRARAEVG